MSVMMRLNACKRLLLLSLLVAMATPLFAQHLTAHQGDVKNAYNFWFYEPPVDSIATDSVRKPLVVFLHGKSLCGKNLKKVKRYGPINALEMGMHIDAYVLAPQTRGSWSPERVLRLVDWAAEHYAVDTNRVYLIGMSLGGYGTLDVAGTYPDRFAAAMALCGGSTLKDFCGLNRLPLWILHGTADRAVGIGASQRVVDAMGNCDTTARLIWTPLKGANHGRLARIFYLPKTYEWLFSHSLADSARTVNRDYDITVEELADRGIYREVRSGGNKVVTKKAVGDSDISETSENSEYPDDSEVQYHKLKKGDTLSKLARRYHTTVKKLCSLNGIKSTDKLQIGKRLRVK